MSKDRPRIVTGGDERPKWLRWLLVGGGVVLLVAAGYAVYSFTTDELSERYAAATGDRERLLALRRDLAERLRAEQEETEALRERLAYLEKSQQIDREACQQLRESLRDMQSRLVDAQEQLAFYRGIVTPENEARGIRVHDIIFRRRGKELRYELVLVQGRNQSDRVRGRFALEVDGMRDGEAETVQVRNAEGEADMLFSFRHFQEFTGQLVVPEGFSPREVRVRLRPEGKDDPVNSSYEWQRVVAARGD